MCQSSHKALDEVIKSEGFIYGLSAKMFTVAGPIIVFGIIGSVITGLAYYVIGLIF